MQPIPDTTPPVYSPPNGVGFGIVVEGAPGLSGDPVDVDIVTYEPNLTGFPDLQIEASQLLGNGSPSYSGNDLVCSGTRAGGVPGIWPVDFDPTLANIIAVNDLACRFVNGLLLPRGRSKLEACVQYVDINGKPNDVYGYANPSSSQIEYCSLVVEASFRFPQGDTILTARLRDTGGNVGAPAQIIVRVP
jgi:hypothetical protein